MNRNSGSFKKMILYLWPFVLAVLVFLTTKIAIRNPGVVEHYYSQGIYPGIAGILSAFSRLFPFSLWDIFWTLVIVLIVAGLILVLIRKIKPGRYVLRILQLTAFLYCFFYMVWGYNYFRPGIATRTGWKDQGNDTVAFRSILDSLITQANRNYVSVSTSDYSLFDELIEESYRKNSARLEIKYPNGSRRPKKMIYSTFFSKSGVSGYFGPFFNEIHINRNLLPMDYPFLLGHEKAHQFGITSEAEANLYGFIVCTTSEDKRLRYSGYQFLLLYFLRDASRMGGYRGYLKKIDKSVLDDLRARQKYYDSLQNKSMSDMQTAVNNSYLKANNIEKGVKNYNQVVALVISWYNNSNNY